MIHTVTAIVDRQVKLFGYFRELKDAKKAVKRVVIYLRDNDLHMQECLYRHIVIEEVDQGILPHVTKQWWYEWNSKDEKWHKSKKPEWARHTTNWAIR